MFPGEVIYEEITVPGSSLYLDIFMPNIGLIVEVHGRQHYEHVPFFHKTKMEFLMAQKRDRDKIEWSNLNGFRIAVLPYNREEEWRQIILQALEP